MDSIGLLPSHKVIHKLNEYIPMEINPQNVCEVLRALRIIQDIPPGTYPTYGLFQHLLLKVAHHIEEHNKLPSLKQIRRWQSAALKINE